MKVVSAHSILEAPLWRRKMEGQYLLYLLYLSYTYTHSLFRNTLIGIINSFRQHSTGPILRQEILKTGNKREGCDPKNLKTWFVRVSELLGWIRTHTDGDRVENSKCERITRGTGPVTPHNIVEVEWKRDMDRDDNHICVRPGETFLQ